MTTTDHIDEAIAVLNRALNADPAAISALFAVQIQCTGALADDPTIQVRAGGDVPTFGALGLINGLFGIQDDGWGHIAAAYDVICSAHGIAPGSVGERCPATPCERTLDLGPLVEFRRVIRPDPEVTP